MNNCAQFVKHWIQVYSEFGPSIDYAITVSSRSEIKSAHDRKSTECCLTVRNSINLECPIYRFRFRQIQKFALQLVLPLLNGDGIKNDTTITREITGLKLDTLLLYSKIIIVFDDILTCDEPMGLLLFCRRPHCAHIRQCK